MAPSEIKTHDNKAQALRQNLIRRKKNARKPEERESSIPNHDKNNGTVEVITAVDSDKQ